MRNVVRSYRATYRKPDGIIRLTKIMREQIEQLIAELQAKAQKHESDADAITALIGGVTDRAKAIATYHCIARLYLLLADSKPVSADLGTVDRVGDSE